MSNNFTDIYAAAEIYDTFFSPKKDIQFWLNVAKEMIAKKEEPILELGSGTARILLPLAEAGYRVYGLECCPEMLEVARQKIEQNGKIRESITLIPGDMRDFSLSNRFKLIIVAYSTWFDLHSEAERMKAAHCVFNHLKEDGYFVVDNALYQSEDLRKYRWGNLRHRETVPLKSNESLSCFQVDTFDEQATSSNRGVMLFVDKVAENGQVERKIYEHHFTPISPDKMIEELKTVGFSTITIYGGYEKFDQKMPYHPSDETNDRQIFCVRR